MKPPKDNTIEVVLSIFIGIIAIGLTYFGAFAFPDSSQSTALERVLALPMFAAVFVFTPHSDLTGFVPIVLAWTGSIVIYAALGVAILCAVQSWMRRRRNKKGKDNRI